MKPSPGMMGRGEIEKSVREWIARHHHSPTVWHRQDWKPTYKDVREVGYAIEWAEVEDDETRVAIRYELRDPDGKWRQSKITLARDPAVFLEELIDLYELDATTAASTPRVDAAIARVQGAHWGGQLRPPTKTVTTPVFMRFFHDALTLASEVRRLRTIIGELSARQPTAGVGSKNSG